MKKGRPLKDEKDKKTRLCSFRLKEAEYLFLIGKYETIQNAIDKMTQKEIGAYKKLIERLVAKY